MSKSEQTSHDVSSIAGKILEMKNPRLITDEFWAEIQSVAASALTQVADKTPLKTDYSYRKVVKLPPSRNKLSMERTIARSIHGGFGK